MDTFDKTLLVSSEEELQKIYDEEGRKLHENGLIVQCLKLIKIEDLPKNLPEKSRKSIEMALLAVKIHDHSRLSNNQKVLGLDEFDLKNITLSFSEKKVVGEIVEKMVDKECARADHFMSHFDPDILPKAEEKMMEVEKERQHLTETYLHLKNQELELLKEVAEILVGPNQKDAVQAILEESQINEIKVQKLTQVMADGEMTKSTYSKKAIGEASTYIDSLLKEKEERSNN